MKQQQQINQLMQENNEKYQEIHKLKETNLQAK